MPLLLIVFSLVVIENCISSTTFFFFFTESYLLTLRMKSNNIQNHILSLILTRINPSLEVTLFTTENQNGIPEILPLVPDTVCMNGGANERPGPLENPNCLVHLSGSFQREALTTTHCILTAMVSRAPEQRRGPVAYPWGPPCVVRMPQLVPVVRGVAKGTRSIK